MARKPLPDSPPAPAVAPEPAPRPAAPQQIGYDDNPNAPQTFADEAVGFWLHNGVVMLTFTSTHIDHHINPGPITRQVVNRVVMPVAGAQQLAAGLYNFLKLHGLDPVPRPPDGRVQ